jgi:hypothetical protein
LDELEIYSSRLGMLDRSVSLSTPVALSDRRFTSLRGYRRYEGSNHLGNVLSVISDRKLGVYAPNRSLPYYRAEVLSASYYYAFGSSMKGRGFAGTNDYRFGLMGRRKQKRLHPVIQPLSTGNMMAGWADGGIWILNQIQR